MGQSRGSGALTLRYEVNFILLFSAPWVLRMRFITQSQIRHRLDASQTEGLRRLGRSYTALFISCSVSLGAAFGSVVLLVRSGFIHGVKNKQ